MTTKSLDIRHELKHSRVKRYLLDQMTAERLRAGDALPTESTLAETLQVGRNTVRQALAELTRDGIVERVQGRGTFVTREVQRPRNQEVAVFGIIVSSVRSNLYPALIKGVGEVAEAANHAISVYETGNDVRGQGNAILQAIDKGVAGLIIVPVATAPTPEFQLRQLQAHGIPVVFCHRRPEGFPVPCITWPWEKVAISAARTLVEQGHRRIGFAAWLRYCVTEAYERAFRAELAELGMDLPDSRIYWNPELIDPFRRQPVNSLPDDDAHRELVALLQSPQRPTAVFATDVEIAEQVYLHALRLGLRVPEDLSIVSFGAKLRDGAVREQLTAWTIDEVEVGRRAARILNDICHGRTPQQPHEPVYMPLEFAPGRTLAPASSRLARFSGLRT